MPEKAHKQAFFRYWTLLLRIFVFFPPLMFFFLLGNNSFSIYRKGNLYSWQDFGVAAGLCILISLSALLLHRVLMLYEKKHPRKTIEFDREVLQQVKQTSFDRITFLTFCNYLLGFLVCFAVSVFVYDWLIGILEGVFFYFCWIRLYRSADKPYHKLISFIEYIVTGGIYLAGFIAVFLMRLFFRQTGFELSAITLLADFSIDPLILAFGFYTVSAGFLLNQANLDRTMESMKHSKSSLPQKIRLYNMFFISTVMTFLIIGLIFRNQIVNFLGWCGKTLLYFVIVIVSFILKILTLGSFQMGEETDEMPTSPGGLTSQAGGNPFWDLILVALLIGLIIYLISPPGRRFLKKIVSLPRKAFNALLFWISAKTKRNMIDGDETYYIDQEEDLVQMTESGEKPQNLKRMLKKQLKEWQKLTDPAQKLRAGYGLMRNYAVLQQDEIAPTDTVKEAEKKAHLKPYSAFLEMYDPVYEQVRYGEKEINEQEVLRLSREVEQFIS